MQQIVTTNHSPVTDQRVALLARRERLLGSFSEALRHNKRKRCRLLYERLCLTNEAVSLLEKVSESAAVQDGRNHYLISSLFLRDCYKELTADKNEQFFFITGPEQAGRFCLSQRLAFSFQRRTPTSVVGDFPSTHSLLIQLEQFGHRLTGQFHSHPGDGPDMTQPSGTDRDFQQRLEQAGHVTVAAIFSRDGFVKFFRLDNNLEVEVYGTGVEKHEADLFKLTEVH